MSNRMMKILQTFTPDIAAYSIDKSFLDLSPLPSSPVQPLRKESTTPSSTFSSLLALRR
jgi:nucleotidyltransferase/DNA polymerase involved in DNA repair